NIGGRCRRIAPGTSECGLCGATFTRKDRLKYHYDSKHLKVLPKFLCEIKNCSKAFRQRSDLIRHIKHVHRHDHNLNSSLSSSSSSSSLSNSKNRRKSN
ncbi:hypothetical protein CROQUDRAFT_55317, partial [Cronartium quercuum f. sp. fusiforme G11]